MFNPPPSLTKYTGSAILNWILGRKNISKFFLLLFRSPQFFTRRLSAITSKNSKLHQSNTDSNLNTRAPPSASFHHWWNHNNNKSTTLHNTIQRETAHELVILYTLSISLSLSRSLSMCQPKPIQSFNWVFTYTYVRVFSIFYTHTLRQFSSA